MSFLSLRRGFLQKTIKFIKLVFLVHLSIKRRRTSLSHASLIPVMIAADQPAFSISARPYPLNFLSFFSRPAKSHLISIIAEIGAFTLFHNSKIQTRVSYAFSFPKSFFSSLFGQTCSARQAAEPLPSIVFFFRVLVGSPGGGCDFCLGKRGPSLDF